jgi:hypothetical protein
MCALSHIRPGHLSGCPEPPMRHQARRGGLGGGCVLSTACATHATVGAMIKKGVASAPKGPKHFWVPNNIVKYDGKTNPSIWLEDYHLACRADMANDDLFII